MNKRKVSTGENWNYHWELPIRLTEPTKARGRKRSDGLPALPKVRKDGKKR